MTIFLTHTRHLTLFLLVLSTASDIIFHRDWKGESFYSGILIIVFRLNLFKWKMERSAHSQQWGAKQYSRLPTVSLNGMHTRAMSAASPKKKELMLNS